MVCQILVNVYNDIAELFFDSILLFIRKKDLHHEPICVHYLHQISGLDVIQTPASQSSDGGVATFYWNWWQV